MANDTGNLAITFPEGGRMTFTVKRRSRAFAAELLERAKKERGIVVVTGVFGKADLDFATFAAEKSVVACENAEGQKVPKEAWMALFEEYDGIPIQINDFAVNLQTEHVKQVRVDEGNS